MLTLEEAVWKSELELAAARNHSIVGWAAIVLHPLFAFSDYLNIPEHWLEVFYLRLAMSTLTLGAMFLFKRKHLSPYLFITIAGLLISVQNSYTYQFLDANTLLAHNLNYLGILVGAGLFIMCPLRYSLSILWLIPTSSFCFAFQNPLLDPLTFLSNGGILLFMVMLLSTFLVQSRYRGKEREIKGRLALENALATSAAQRMEITEKNKMLEQQATDLQNAQIEIEEVNAKLHDQNTHLEQLVEERTSALRKSSSERDMLVYRLSHDFKTPMVNIRSMVGLVEKFPNSDQKSTFFQKIYQSLNRFDGLVRDLESFPVYTREELVLEPFDFKQQLAMVWEILAGFRKVGDTYSLVQDSATPLVSDREKFQSIALALLSNSLLYRHPERAVHIDVEVRPHNSGHSISFRDNGTGIPADIQDRVFELFFRGDKRSKGTGLGLYLVQGIAGQLGGGVKILSEEGVGTEVVVELEALPN